MKEKISIIVPIYNVEKYIRGCIESLCAQTYTDIEILLVDDGAKDDSGRICDEYAKRDKRIRVFHIQNGGQSHARNVGLDHATGEYIGFVDGDDAVQPQMYEKLLLLMNEKNAEIAECNFTGRKAPEPDKMPEGNIILLSGREALEQNLDMRVKTRFPSTSVWSKLFKREVLEGLSFPAGRIHEEYGFLCKAIYRCSTYIYLNEPLYRRTLRADSTTAAPFSIRAFDKLAVYKERDDFLKEMGETELLSYSLAQRYDLMLHYYNHSMENDMKKQAEELWEEMKQQYYQVQKSPLLWKRKVLILLFVRFKGGYNFLKRLKRD